MGTEDNPRFGREKVLPGSDYLQSSEYRTRFGEELGGRFLVVTTSERKVDNLIKQTESVLRRARKTHRAKYFLYTTFAAVKSDTVLSEPLWYPALSGQ